ncbi:MAG: NAD(P)-dependent oxidoreductase, partial [Acidobacteria bacterium]|nr:NAD(P)-dependent oxidoreductase [Acidobacteriota bacterium]
MNSPKARVAWARSSPVPDAVCRSTPRSPRLLVTGSTGFIGSALLQHATARGIACAGLARRPTIVPGVDSHAGRVDDPAAVRLALRDVGVVIHAAGLAHQRGLVDEADYIRANVEGTRTVIGESARAGVSHVVLLSSVSVYGRRYAAPDESCEPRPESPYGRSKWEAERVATREAEAAGLPLTILRPSTVIGQGDPGPVAALGRLLQRGPFVRFGSGAARKTIIDVDDFAAAIVARALEPAAGVAVYNVGGWQVPLADIITALATELDVTMRGPALPGIFARVLAASLRPFGRIGSAAWLRGRLEAALADTICSTERWDQRFGPAAVTPWPESLAREAQWLKATSSRTAASRR